MVICARVAITNIYTSRFLLKHEIISQSQYFPLQAESLNLFVSFFMLYKMMIITKHELHRKFVSLKLCKSQFSRCNSMELKDKCTSRHCYEQEHNLTWGCYGIIFKEQNFNTHSPIHIVHKS